MREKALLWYNSLTRKEIAEIERKYHTLLITDSNIERVYKLEI